MMNTDRTESLSYWLFDTRLIWNEQSILSEAASLSLVWGRHVQAPHALALVHKEEAQKAKSYHFLRDGKLSLGSTLLKRLFASRVIGIPWRDAKFFRRENAVHGKPCLSLASSSASEDVEVDADFNIAHQAGLVVLIGSPSKKVLVGIDISCTNERQNQFEKLNTEKKVDEWIDIFGEVFSPADLGSMKASMTQQPADKATGEKLRRFYAYWALKEAYIKMVGEGLLAKWLQDVEFRNVRIPQPADSPHVEAHTERPSFSWPWGEVVTDIEVWISGRKSKEDVHVTLQAFEDCYLIATCISPATPPFRPPRFETVTLENGIYNFAQKV